MTEKNYNPEKKQMKAMKKQEVIHSPTKEISKKEKSEMAEMKKDEMVKEEKIEATEKKEHKKPEGKPRKTKAVVNGVDIPISTKHSMAICRFIKRKRIQQAIKELEQVAKLKRAIPMKGEIPHRKGEIMSGRFPEKAAKQFIILLKSLASNAIHDGIEDPVIVEAFANLGARPFGRQGVRRKRTHIKIVAESKMKKENKK